MATNIPAHHGLSGVAGSGQVWFVDALYHDHAEVEDRVKAIKRVGMGLLPSKSWQVNAAWVLAATLAADLDAWIRLLLLHDEPELAAAEPESIRRKLYHLPARLTTHARTRTLHLNHAWPWATAFTTAWRRAHQLAAHLTADHVPTKTRTEDTSSTLGPVEPDAPAASRDGPSRHGKGHNGQPVAHGEAVRTPKNRG